MQNLRKQLANELANDCKTVTDVRNAINSLFKEALESILEAEITEHLGYEKHMSITHSWIHRYAIEIHLFAE